ncbi:GntR family transcriptional regulator [Anaerophilus nitritogenes]|uniref:GntR family transcriptional regulator n=1 Tax=Anaerophilus nitritogenes TaxID=2498136 RepID=UPI00101B5E15|nr:GntR family transcriptional regulator [Anaerophilus nitritogenes]
MFIIDPRSSTPIYQQIIEGVKENILKGLIEPGDKMPSVRELAKMMTLNPNTVAKAYQELERQKVIETFRGRGTFVSMEYEAKKDGEKMTELKDIFKKAIVEAYYMGIDKKEIMIMIDEIIKELEGGSK